MQIPRHVAEKAAMKTRGLAVRTDSDGDLCFDDEAGDECIGYFMEDGDGLEELVQFNCHDIRIADLWRRFFINLIEMTGIPNITGRPE